MGIGAAVVRCIMASFQGAASFGRRCRFAELTPNYP